MKKTDKQHSHSESGCYTLGLETDEVAEANAKETASLRVVIPYANSP